MTARVCVLVVALFVNFRSLYACNGYTFKLNSVKDCNGNSVIQADPNFDMTLDNDCNFLITGCINITKPIKLATGTYNFKKAPLPPLEGEADFCDSLSTFDFPAIRETITSFGMPLKCPYKAQRACAKPNSKVNISPFKSQLALAAGTTEIKFDVEHDTGKTCVQSKFTFTKARKG